MKNIEKFKNFINTLKTEENSVVLESATKAFGVLFEDEYHDQISKQDLADLEHLLINNHKLLFALAPLVENNIPNRERITPLFNELQGLLKKFADRDLVRSFRVLGQSMKD